METLTETVEKQARENEQDSSPEEDDEDDDVAALSTPKKKQVSGGLAAKKEISPSLAHFLGQGGVMARTEIVKALWEYIRTHNLQNPANKQEIVLDEAMRAVFECKVFTMFTMNKYISAHVHPFKAVDLTPTPKASRKRKSPGSAKSAKSAASSGKKRKAGTQPPYRLSEALTVVVGTDILPRPQVVSKLWVYIRAHNLQNPKDKREILCDSALRKVFGGKAKGTSHTIAQGCC
jgi:upstream activation factor subunit UAF30